jgi:hypothetical protein
MKINNYKLLALGGLLFIVASSLDSCVKSRSGETDFGGLKPIVLIPEGGTGGTKLTFPPTDDTDTTLFHLNYAATTVAPADETITIAIDQTQIAAFNSNSTIQYTIFPDSIYSFKTTTVTIKKGNNYSDAIAVALFPSKIDLTQNYILPITIKTAPSGATISGNFGTVYYTLVGNKLAGAYNGFGTRYNYTGAVSYSYPGPYPTPVSTINLANQYPKIAAGDDATTLEIPYSSIGGGTAYVVKTDPVTNQVVSLTANAALKAAVSGFSVYYANYDNPTKTFHFITHYNNDPTGAAGNDRIIDETMIHP